MNSPTPEFQDLGACAHSTTAFAQASSNDLVLEALPPIMRVESLTRTLDSHAIHNRAVLFHRKATLCVDWVSQQVDTRLHRHGLILGTLCIVFRLRNARMTARLACERRVNTVKRIKLGYAACADTSCRCII
jgi:hypothetical protein